MQFTYETPDSSRGEIASKTMSLVLSELSQLVVGFTYCYENEMSHWCNKTPPILNELGPAFKRVYNLLQTFIKVNDVKFIEKLQCENTKIELI